MDRGFVFPSTTSNDAVRHVGNNLDVSLTVGGSPVGNEGFIPSSSRRKVPFKTSPVFNIGKEKESTIRNTTPIRSTVPIRKIKLFRNRTNITPIVASEEKHVMPAGKTPNGSSEASKQLQAPEDCNKENGKRDYINQN